MLKMINPKFGKIFRDCQNLHVPENQDFEIFAYASKSGAHLKQLQNLDRTFTLTLSHSLTFTLSHSFTPSLSSEWKTASNHLIINSSLWDNLCKLWRNAIDDWLKLYINNSDFIKQEMLSTCSNAKIMGRTTDR